MTQVNQQYAENLQLELRRGVIVLAVLSQLRQTHYGYSLRQALADKGFDVNEGTLYPLLRRLESQGLLNSEWDLEEGGRPRRYYTLSELGQTIFTELKAEWKYLGMVMEGLLVDENKNETVIE
ncbi:MAG TPA: PadR family transcriptional regulator [Chloroflexota bacterium]|nr:PadR family transcriptional regulator [Chloroflexota bacterium]HUM69922.1 PadR family transcriptional regulator [Chloroflexota bacterium]